MMPAALHPSTYAQFPSLPRSGRLSRTRRSATRVRPPPSTTAERRLLSVSVADTFPGSLRSTAFTPNPTTPAAAARAHRRGQVTAGAVTRATTSETTALDTWG